MDEFFNFQVQKGTNCLKIFIFHFWSFDQPNKMAAIVNCRIITIRPKLLDRDFDKTGCKMFLFTLEALDIALIFSYTLSRISCEKKCSWGLNCACLTP